MKYASEWIKTYSDTINRVTFEWEDKKVLVDEFVHNLSQEFISSAKEDNVIFILGNGGSNAIASHLSQDINNKCNVRSLSIDSSSYITCQTNDYGYDKAFSNFIRTFARLNDLGIFISSSGNSENICNAINQFSNVSERLILLSGFEKNNRLNNEFSSLGKAFVNIKKGEYGIVECAHQMILHIVIDFVSSK